MGTYDGEHARTKAKPKKLEEGPGWFREPFSEIDGRKCLNGTGPVPAKVLFVDKVPDEREVWTRKPYSGRTGQFLFECLKKAGWSKEQIKACRFTYATHHAPKKYTAAEVNWGKRMFREELYETGAEIVVCFGAEPLKQVVGPTYRWDDVHGAFIKPDSIEDCWFTMFPTFNLEQVLFGPKWDKYFLRDLEWIRRRMEGDEIKPPRCDHAVIADPRAIDMLRETLERYPGKTVVALDCEWNGRNWMDPERYLRTVQIGFRKGRVMTVELNYEGGRPVMEPGVETAVMDALKRFLESPKICICGHNVIADGEWLLSYGIDIREHVVYDTMLAEHIIDQNGPFGLEALSMKYTDYGRYSTDVEVWVRRHQNAKLPDTSAYGYGYVPRDMLLKYGYIDVDVLHYIMEKQIPILRERGCLKPRGLHKEYPSLFHTVMKVQKVTYDLELNGLPVDMAQLDMLTEKYQKARSETLSKVMAMARAAGFEDFNPRSAIHLRKMLFGVLGLTPIKTTDGDDWGDVAGEMGMDSEEEVSASTDKTTLQILEGQHPFVDALLDFRRVDQVCKTWLTKEKDGEPAGLYALLWPDCTLKPHYSPLTATGRMRVSAPNSQNFPKAAESYLTKIFGEGNEPPMIRTIVKPRNEWIQIEADFCAAELNILGNLSQDPNMLRALNTPGLDLHDKTAVDSFGLVMYDENGREVTEDDLVRLAAEMGEESDDYQHFMKTLTYVDKQGKRMTRSEMKSSIRVIAKSLNFGIAYGRGARAISLAVKAQTGSKEPLDAIIPGVAASVEGWKTKAYPVAWKWLVDHQQMIYDPGYVENPWGRRKYVYLRNGEKSPSLEREAGNFPIQSCCADSVQIAMGKLLDFKETAGFPFRIQNQIHDALMIETPREHIEEAKEVLRKSMSEIDIPIPGTSKTFRLGVDIDVYERWGVKMK